MCFWETKMIWLSMSINYLDYELKFNVLYLKGKAEGLKIVRSGLHDNWDDAEGYYSKLLLLSVFF